MSKDAEQLEQLTAYLDGELPADQRAEVEKLIADNEDARVLMEELRQTSHLVAGLSRERAPDNLADAVTARLERQALLDEPSKRPGWPWMGKLAAAAVFALACTIGWYAWPGLTRPEAENNTITLARTEKSAVPTAPKEESLAMADAGRKEAVPETVYGDESARRLDVSQASPAMKEIVQKRKVAAARSATVGMVSKTNDKNEPTETAAIRENPSFEARLASNQLTNSLVLNADLESFGNRIRVETTDAASVERLTDEIKDYATRESIPNAQTAALAEPIPSDQIFYAIQESDALRSIAEASASGPSDERLVVFNLREDQAAKLITSLQQNADDNNSSLRWTANNFTLPENRSQSVTQEIMKRIVKPDEGSSAGATATERISRAAGGYEEGSSQPKKGLAGTQPQLKAPENRKLEKKSAIPEGAHELDKADRREKDRFATDRDEATDEEEEREETNMGDSDLRRERRQSSIEDKPAQGDGLQSQRPSSGDKPRRAAPVSFVTFAISLRSNPMLGPKFQTGRSVTTQSVTTPIPPMKPATSQSTSQPTSQGTPGG
ncbi:MAG: hypothetical protein MI923_16635 [Phycisphaerales bacterium]|nr:hypothetical protein [Phycisphaerales bacterium]